MDFKKMSSVVGPDRVRLDEHPVYEGLGAGASDDGTYAFFQLRHLNGRRAGSLAYSHSIALTKGRNSHVGDPGPAAAIGMP